MPSYALGALQILDLFSGFMFCLTSPWVGRRHTQSMSSFSVYLIHHLLGLLFFLAINPNLSVVLKCFAQANPRWELQLCSDRVSGGFSYHLKRYIGPVPARSGSDSRIQFAAKVTCTRSPDDLAISSRTCIPKGSFVQAVARGVAVAK